MAKTVLLMALATLAASPLYAWDFQVTAHVKIVESTYMPGQVKFVLDGPAGNCSQGTFLVWNARGSNDTQQAASAGGALSLLLTAKATGSAVSIGGYNSGCTIDYIYEN